MKIGKRFSLYNHWSFVFLAVIYNSHKPVLSIIVRIVNQHIRVCVKLCHRHAENVAKIGKRLLTLGLSPGYVDVKKVCFEMLCLLAGQHTPTKSIFEMLGSASVQNGPNKFSFGLLTFLFLLLDITLFLDYYSL
jgi:hypothetical protein